MKMSDCGEKKFLNGLLPLLHKSDNFINGFGHDASIIDVGLDKNIAFKIDRASRPVMLKTNPESFIAWGKLAVTSNISDLLAVGAEPKAFMVSIIVPSTYEASDVTNIIKGCEQTCNNNKVSFVGGDTKEGEYPQVVGSAFGLVDKTYFLGRKTARPGDKLVIVGFLGGFLGAYLQLQNNLKLNKPYDTDLLNFISNPQPLLKEAMKMTSLKLASSACDLSDGLVDALSYFCSDEVGVTITFDDLPMHRLALDASRKLNLEYKNFAFGVGDWAIAYTLPIENIEAFTKACPRDLPIKIVGEFTNSKSRIIKTRDGTIYNIPNITNEHFRQRLEDESVYLNMFK